MYALLLPHNINRVSFYGLINSNQHMVCSTRKQPSPLKEALHHLNQATPKWEFKTQLQSDGAALNYLRGQKKDRWIPH